MRLGQEHHRSDHVNIPMHFVQRHLMLVSSVTGDVNFDPLVKMVSV